LNKTKKNRANRQGLIADDTNNLGNKNSLLQEGSEYIQKFTNYPSNVIYFDVEHKRLHPTQKPTALLEYLIKTYTNKDEWVLDNCMGSGSTGVACINTKRNFIGIEKDDKYFEIAEQRIEESKKNIFNL
jgi:site-specific DNA-methyltransferase (adenine-specific)